MQFWKKPQLLKLDIHFSCILFYTSHYLCTIKKTPFMFTCSNTGYKPLPVITTKISLDQSFTILVIKHNIQVSTKWLPINKILNFILKNYISTKDIGFNLPLIHFQISFKTHSIHHNIKNNSILNYALSTKISFCLRLNWLGY